MRYFKLVFALFLSYSLSVSCRETETMEVSHNYVIDENLPGYYSRQYLPVKIMEVNKSCSRGNHLMDSFVFITDTHWEKNSCYSGLLIKSILDNTPVDKVVHGGDAGSVTAYDSKLTGYDLINDNMEKFQDCLIQHIGSHSFYAVRGNHDFNNVMDEGMQDGYPISEVRDFYMSFMPVVNNNSQDNNGLYYYFDNQKTKIRYIVTDTSYGYKIDRAGLGASQLRWLLDNAITTTPDGYSIVLFSHIPVSLGVDTTGDYKTFVPLKTILSAVNKKENGSVVCEDVEIPYDFTTSKYNVLCVISGHIHADSQAYDEQVLYITTTCDRVSNDMPSQFDEDSRQTRQPGDVTEQAFDVVALCHSEHNWIDLNRIGAGFSRYYNRDIITLKVGESIDLNKEISKISPVKWDGNDSPGPIGNWYTKEWVRSSTVLELHDGVIEAKKTGSSIVYAEDNECNKEFFLIDVKANT